MTTDVITLGFVLRGLLHLGIEGKAVVKFVRNIAKT
jgi:hypothetical protein